MTVAFATFAGLPGADEDAAALAAELTALGIGSEPAVWDDPAVDWDRYDLVMIRSVWDYSWRRDEFLAWAGTVPRLVNPAGVLRWNTDKRYLEDLAAAGVPVVPTRWDPDDVPGDWPEYVIKPAVSAGAADTARWTRGERDEARAHLRRLREAGRTVMVQPYLAAVDTQGETALLFCEGEFTHSARKSALLGAGAGVRGRPDVLGGRSHIGTAEATPAELAAAEKVLAAVPGDLLYARVDLIPGPDGAPTLLELELTEPALFFAQAPHAAARYAAALARRIRG